jgi:OOP family OmpA-OmpF porin
MRFMSKRSAVLILLAMPVSASLSAQQQEPAQAAITVTGAPMPAGPEVKGIISARNDEKIKITAADGTITIISVNDDTRINRGKYNAASLLNGLPVTVKTLQSPSGLIAGQITFRNKDLKTANMIRSGTAQQFDEQTAATEALRGRMADIDKYNIKSTTNVYFATGKWMLTGQAKAELCAAATGAEATDNALMLVVGYTDSVGSDEYNQTLSEKRASSVINYLQQACRWKPYRMLTPTGMAESDPLASNDTAEGKAQNRRVSVNILVSKSIDGM